MITVFHRIFDRVCIKLHHKIQIHQLDFKKKWDKIPNTKNKIYLNSLYGWSHVLYY